MKVSRVNVSTRQEDVVYQGRYHRTSRCQSYDQYGTYSPRGGPIVVLVYVSMPILTARVRRCAS